MELGIEIWLDRPRLEIEQAQTRTVPRRRGWYNLSTHFPWIGLRTNDPRGAHVEFFRGIRNPIAVKVGPGTTGDQLERLLEVLHQDYIRTARAKGLAERKVMLRHAWRNSLIPIVTLVGFSVSNLVAGSYVIEVIFSWPGMAQFGFEAILNRDYPVIMGVTLFSSLFIIFGNLLADLAYIVVNPQVSTGARGR